MSGTPTPEDRANKVATAIGPGNMSLTTSMLMQKWVTREIREAVDADRKARGEWPKLPPGELQDERDVYRIVRLVPCNCQAADSDAEHHLTHCATNSWPQLTAAIKQLLRDERAECARVAREWSEQPHGEAPGCEAAYSEGQECGASEGIAAAILLRSGPPAEEAPDGQ